MRPPFFPHDLATSRHSIVSTALQPGLLRPELCHDAIILERRYCPLWKDWEGTDKYEKSCRNGRVSNMTFTEERSSILIVMWTGVFRGLRQLVK